MSYLALLKAVFSENGLLEEPTKLTKAPSVGFVSTEVRAKGPSVSFVSTTERPFPEIDRPVVPAHSCTDCLHLSVFGDCKAPVLADLTDRFCLVEPPPGYGSGCRAFSSRTSPDPVQAELTGLVDAVATFHAFSPQERQEALEIALADPETALRCFRALAAEIGRSTGEPHLDTESSH